MTQSIETARNGARELSKAFASARDEYDRLVVERDVSTSPADYDLAAEEDLRKRVDRLSYSHDKAKQNILHVGDQLPRAAAAESESASRLARQFQQLSWALYILGTLIILFGRTKSILGGKKTPED